MFDKIKRIFRREKSNEQEAIAGGRRKSLLERVRRSIIPDDLTFSSLKRASQLDPNRRRSTRKIAENKHVSVTKKKVDEIIVKEPRVSQYLKIEHDNRRKGSNSLIWTVSEKTDRDTKIRRQFKHLETDEQKTEKNPSSILRKTHTSPNFPISQNHDESRKSFKKPNRRKSAPANRTRQ